MDIFKGRKLLIATKHKKEKVIAPILETSLGVKCVVKKGLDTDQFGTFSGEIERTDSALNTARKKCLEAIKNTNYDLVIASEGSFGPHPSYFFIPANEETIVLMDLKHGLEIVAKTISTNTNFSSSLVKDKDSLLNFLEKVQFPEHAIIIKDLAKPTLIYKGIKSRKKILGLYRQLSDNSANIQIETDMRAMHNPSRMKVIEECVLKLLQKAQSKCPECQIPGFDVTKAIPGLPCELCGTPGKSIKQLLYTCQKCQYTVSHDYPQQKTKEDPRFCDVCNP